jgi:hypothetical protein
MKELNDRVLFFISESPNYAVEENEYIAEFNKSNYTILNFPKINT